MQIKSEHNPTLHLGKRAGVAQEVNVPREGQEIRDFQQFFFFKQKHCLLWQNRKARDGTRRKVFQETFLVVCCMLVCEKQSK